MPTTDTLIIGASAAGLATSACLGEQGIDHVIVERTDEIGVAWRNHYRRLHLHTPKRGSNLPGLKFDSDLPRYPSREDVISYLEGYASYFGIQPRFGVTVDSVSATRGGWTTVTDSESYTSKRVVVATGYTNTPVVPRWADQDVYEGEVLHSSEYLEGSKWRGKPVLIVGFGNSACEIAIDLHEFGAKPQISVRHAVNVIPRDLLGVPVLQLGILGGHLPPRLADLSFAPLIWATIGSLKGTGLRKLPYGPMSQIANDKSIPLLDIGTMDLIRSGDLVVRPAIECFEPHGVRFADGTEGEFAAVVLGTGYRPSLETFIEAADSVLDSDGVPFASGTESSLAGLYFCGFHVVPSGQLRQIGREASQIASEIADS
jgi:indole-3-pyruvate monooxygenase